MTGLKTLHPYLYRRVFIKGILFGALGVTQIFSPYLNNLLHIEPSPNSTGIPTLYTGLVFLIIGFMILRNVAQKTERYKRARKWLYAAAVYALFWEFVLLMLVITQNISTSSLFVLWSYLTYNIFLVARDTGWEGAELVKEIRENGNDSQ